MMGFEIAALSSRGGRHVNEDTCGWWTGRDLAFCVVSDGAGGHRGGDVASKLVVEETLERLRSSHDCSAGNVEAAMRQAHERLLTEQRRDAGLLDMRATAVVLAIDAARHAAAWGHLGDSRLYCFRENRIAIQTRDHSMVQALIDAGLINAEDARTSPQRNKLLNAMGHDTAFEPCLDGIAFAPEADDKFLLCTDGLWALVKEPEMERALEDCASAEDWLRALESHVLARASGRHDNYSALALWCTAGKSGGLRVTEP